MERIHGYFHGYFWCRLEISKRDFFQEDQEDEEDQADEEDQQKRLHQKGLHQKDLRQEVVHHQRQAQKRKSYIQNVNR